MAALRFAWVERVAVEGVGSRGVVSAKRSLWNRVVRASSSRTSSVGERSVVSSKWARLRFREGRFGGGR